MLIGAVEDGGADAHGRLADDRPLLLGQVRARRGSSATIGLLCSSQSHRCSPERELRPLADRLHLDRVEPGVGEHLAEPLGVVELERQRERVHRRALERRDGGLDGVHEDAEELDRVRVAVRVDEHAAARSHDARHLGDALRHVREQHHAELRAGHVEAVVLELERVAVHHPRLDAQLLVTGSPLESSSITGERSVASTRAPRRAAGMLSAPLPAATSRKRMPGTEPGAAEAFVAQPHLRRGVRAVVAGRDGVPGGGHGRCLQEGVGLLDVRDVARVLDDVQRPSEPRARGLGEAERDEAVVAAPEQRGRDLDPLRPGTGQCRS